MSQFHLEIESTPPKNYKEKSTCHHMDSMIRTNIHASTFSSAVTNNEGSSQLPKLSSFTFLALVPGTESHLSGNEFLFLMLLPSVPLTEPTDAGGLLSPKDLLMITLNTIEFESQKVNLYHKKEALSEKVNKFVEN